jgi:hypothetical protein
MRFIGGQGQQPQGQEEQGEGPFQALELAPGAVAVGETAPFHRQAIQADAAVQFHQEQQDQVQGPHASAPDPVGGLEGADQFRVGHHEVEVHRGQEEHAEAGDDLDEPEGGVLVPHVAHVPPVFRVLAPVGGELAHGQPGVEDEQAEDAGDEQGNQPGQRLAEEIVALEEARHDPHGIVPQQDGGDEEHVQPHEQAQDQAADALQQVHAGGPATGLGDGGRGIHDIGLRFACYAMLRRS